MRGCTSERLGHIPPPVNRKSPGKFRWCGFHLGRELRATWLASGRSSSATTARNERRTAGERRPRRRAPRIAAPCSARSAHARVSGVPSACPSPSQQAHPVGNFAKHASHGPSRVGRGGESACGVQVALRGPCSAGRGGAQGRAASGCAREGRARPKASQQKGDTGDLGRERGLGSR